MSKFEVFYLEAKRKYVEEGYSLKQLKEEFKVSLTTLNKWKNLEPKSWDEQRREYLIAGAGAVAKLRNIILSRINELTEDSISYEIKELYQLKSLLEKFEVQNDLNRHIINAMPIFAKFINEKHPEKKDEIASLIVEFYKWIENKK